MLPSSCTEMSKLLIMQVRDLTLYKITHSVDMEVAVQSFIIM